MEIDAYDPKDNQEPSTSKDFIFLEYKMKAVAYAEEHPKYSLAMLQNQGFRKLKRKSELVRWKKDIEEEGTFIDKMKIIVLEVWEKFQEAQENYEQVTTRTLQQWAMWAAFPLITEKFHFGASIEWIKKFKRKYRIRQRKITKFIGKTELSTMEDVLKAATNFQKETNVLISRFRQDFVINTDQTGCQYNATYIRSLDRQGAKDLCQEGESHQNVSLLYRAI